MTLSQNFIKDPFLVKELLSASSINSDDLVLEIGPGRGIITKELISRSHQIVVVEKDPDLYRNLIDKFKNVKNIKIFNLDFLNFNLPDQSYKVFSNIPFNITAEIVDKFLKSKNKPTEIYFILQTEAAEKYEGTTTETQNSILAKIFYDIEILGNIDRTSFTPKPQVNISFIKFTLKNTKSPFSQREKPRAGRGERDLYLQFRDFVIYGFNQWKGNISEAYKKIFSYNQLKLINKNLKINNLKPTQLTLDQWLNFFDIYQKFVPDDKKELVDGFEKKYLNKIRGKK